MSLFRALVATAALLVGALPCFAQNDQTAEPDPAGDNPFASRKQYQVEVLAFQYRGPDSSGGERLDRLYVEDYLPSDPFDIDEYNRVREAVSYTEVAYLSDAAARLSESPYYEILASAAWVQPLLDRGEAVSVPLGEEAPEASGAPQGDFAGAAPARVSGSVSIYGDYLLFADLDLRVALTGASTGAVDNLQSSGSGFESDSLRGADVFHITERRRIKLDEVHYFDHPYIGILLRVARHEQEEDPAAPDE